MVVLQPQFMTSLFIPVTVSSALLIANDDDIGSRSSRTTLVLQPQHSELFHPARWLIWDVISHPLGWLLCIIHMQHCGQRPLYFPPLRFMSNAWNTRYDVSTSNHDGPRFTVGPVVLCICAPAWASLIHLLWGGDDSPESCGRTRVLVFIQPESPVGAAKQGYAIIKSFLEHDTMKMVLWSYTVRIKNVCIFQIWIQQSQGGKEFLVRGFFLETYFEGNISKIRMGDILSMTLSWLTDQNAHIQSWLFVSSLPSYD